MVDRASSVARYRGNLQGEVDSAALYRAMADAEKDPHLAEVRAVRLCALCRRPGPHLGHARRADDGAQPA